MPVKPWKPTKEQLLAARDKGVRDVIAPNLKVLFVGINPGLYTAAVGHHFGRPGNRFWPALHAGGFTERLLSPFESRELLTYRLGITNLVNRATNMADELSTDELRAGGRRVVAKVRRYHPRIVAVLGVGSYRAAFARPKAVVGPQPDRMDGALVWLLPNPSGLNAHYTPSALASLFAELHKVSEEVCGPG
jgi:TDG/mug DNA glycosylase family protein